MRRFVLLLVAPPLLVIGLVVLPLDPRRAHPLPARRLQLPPAAQGGAGRGLPPGRAAAGRPPPQRRPALAGQSQRPAALSRQPAFAGRRSAMGAAAPISGCTGCWPPSRSIGWAALLGLSRTGAWAAGVFYATGGYFLSLLNLYNLVTMAALAPAFVAAGAGGDRRNTARQPAAAPALAAGGAALRPAFARRRPFLPLAGPAAAGRRPAAARRPARLPARGASSSPRWASAS